MRKASKKRMALPKPPAEPVKPGMSLREFYGVSFMKIAASVLMLGIVSLGVLTPFLSEATVIPCRNIDLGTDDSCPINPTAAIGSTLYFHSSLADAAYPYLYFLIILVFLPYTLGCAAVYLYNRLFGI